MQQYSFNPSSTRRMASRKRRTPKPYKAVFARTYLTIREKHLDILDWHDICTKDSCILATRLA